MFNIQHTQRKQKKTRTKQIPRNHLLYHQDHSDFWFPKSNTDKVLVNRWGTTSATATAQYQPTVKCSQCCSLRIWMLLAGIVRLDLSCFPPPVRWNCFSCFLFWFDVPMASSYTVVIHHTRSSPRMMECFMHWRKVTWLNPCNIKSVTSLF